MPEKLIRKVTRALVAVIDRAHQVGTSLGTAAQATMREGIGGAAALPRDVIERVVNGARSGGRHRHTE